MRLINTKTLHLDEFHGSAIPPYAILSHTWTSSELNFQDWLYVHRQNPPRWGWVHLEDEVAEIKAAKGYRKIRKACEQARKDGYDWIWADTVCIDKTSSAELSEAINSMYYWYSYTEMCYAFLEDVPPSTIDDCSPQGSRFRESRWFRRGWTLQELLAPPRLQFMSSSWTLICTREDVRGVINLVTGISTGHLSGHHSADDAGLPISKVMRWACGRETTREEDAAYCLMGLYGINMPLLYGEGRRAFRRLQLEIMQTRADWTILAWDRAQELTRMDGRYKRSWLLHSVGTLAVEARDFQDSPGTRESGLFKMMHRGLVLRVSNLGLELGVPLMKTPCPLLSFAILPVSQTGRILWMPLWGESERGFRRIGLPSVTFGVAHNEHVPNVTNIVLPIYTEGSMLFAHNVPRLRRAPQSLSMSPVSILLTWPLRDDDDWEILKRFPDVDLGSDSELLDTAILRLRFDDVNPRVAYGAIEIKAGGSWGRSYSLLFAVEFESADNLRPRRWLCSNLGRLRRRHHELGVEVTKKARELTHAEFPLQCLIDNWVVTLDDFTFDAPTKEYIRHAEQDRALSGPVDRDNSKRYEETFIIAQIGRKRKREI